MIGRIRRSAMKMPASDATDHDGFHVVGIVVQWAISLGFFASVLALLALAGCATAPLERAGSLRSYENMTPSDGALTKSLVKVTKADVLTARTVKIVPTAFSSAASAVELTEDQRKLVSNTVDRALCTGLSERFEVVGFAEPADLTVQAVVTHVAPTDRLAAGTSKVAGIVPAFLNLGFPVPVPRIPIGLGSLSVEAEARGAANDQKAAMIWARGADSVTSKPKISTASDAYDLASSFGDDFSKLLVTGDSPFGALPSLPSAQKVGAALGGAHKYPACDAFGRDPGVIGMIGGGVLGIPPEWSDKGASQ